MNHRASWVWLLLGLLGWLLVLWWGWEHIVPEPPAPTPTIAVVIRPTATGSPSLDPTLAALFTTATVMPPQTPGASPGAVVVGETTRAASTPIPTVLATPTATGTPTRTAIPSRSPIQRG